MSGLNMGTGEIYVAHSVMLAAGMRGQKPLKNVACLGWDQSCEGFGIAKHSFSASCWLLFEVLLLMGQNLISKLIKIVII